MSELPDGWAETTLADVAEVRLGRQRSPKTHTGANMRPYLRAANVNWKGFDLSDVKKMHFSSTEVDTYRLRSGEVLVAEASGSRSEVGKPALWQGEIDDCCFQNTLLRVRSRAPNPRYLVHFLRHAALSGKLGDAARGVGIHHIGAAGLSGYHIWLPPLAEQERIVAAIEEQFSRVDDAERSLRSARERLHQLLPRVIDEATEGWPTEQLSELVREPLRNGHSAKRSSHGTLRVFTLTAVTARDFSCRNTKLTDADPGRVKDLWVESGDIFVERSNTPELVGTAALYRGPARRAIFPDLLIRIRMGEAILPEYAEFAMRSTKLRRYFRAAAKGIAGSMPKIDQGAILTAELPVPPIAIQQRIVAEVQRKLTALDSLKTAIDHALARSGHLRRSILHRAFTGRLVPQDPSDEPASELLARVAAERPTTSKPRRRQRA